MWATPADCAAARAAATAEGEFTACAARPATKRLRISPAVSSSPLANARVRAMASRGRPSVGASVSKKTKTRSAQSAAHAATRRRSASLSDCGDGMSHWLVRPRRRRPSTIRMMPTIARMSPIESHIRLPVMKLPGIRFRPCPAQTPPRIRAITPTVIRAMRPLRLVTSTNLPLPTHPSPAHRSSCGTPVIVDVGMEELCRQVRRFVQSSVEDDSEARARTPLMGASLPSFGLSAAGIDQGASSTIVGVRK